MTQEPQSRLAIGVDLGASRIKVTWRSPGNDDLYFAHPNQDRAEVADRVRQSNAACVALTGAGARAFARELAAPTRVVAEFEAFGRGAGLLLQRSGSDLARPFLGVSLGTGTSMLRIADDETRRVGGTALGGGTLVGLDRGLLGCGDFDALRRCASSGDRTKVDLVLADIYEAGDSPLPGDLTAAALEKLGRNENEEANDVAAALFGLVGENVGLLATALARAENLSSVAYAGSALRDNPLLCDLLRAIPALQGLHAVVIENGEFAASLGALEMALAGEA